MEILPAEFGFGKVFVEWRAEHCFSNVKPLEIFLRFSGIPEIVLDIPGENCPNWRKREKSMA